MRVAVGSTNKVKIEAVRRALGPYYDVEVVPIAVGSGVRAQPVGDEAFEGARNRAEGAMKLSKCDLAVGIEGGIMELNGKEFAFAAISIIDAKGQSSSATTGLFQLPLESLRLIGEGLELGEAMDRITGMSDVKHGPGAVGIFTKGVIDRTGLYVHGTTLALIPFLNRHLAWQ